MGLFDFYKRGYQSKAELRTINRNLEAKVGTLTKEVEEFRQIVSKKNNRIFALEGELRVALNQDAKRQEQYQIILRQKRTENANLRKQLKAAYAIIDARNEDRQETDAEKQQPKRRRYSQRGSNPRPATMQLL